ncbi:hypothetical protein AB4305_06605 [Nocardia sp. 2YAB30]|uniref:hypothetical protein n=1 Tax=unclassified Nocardia TaxID=2637762 RepID=UPI003F969C6C
MTATVGISAEQSVVRAVVLSMPQRGVRPTVLCAVEQAAEESPAASAAAALGTITADAGSDTRIDDVAVAYRTVAERRAIVSGLSSAQWRSSSLVSAKMALLALLEDMSGLDHYGTVLVLEVVNYCTSFLVVGPQRDKILACDSWSSGVVDADSASLAIGRIWTTLDGVGMLPDAVVLCGSSAGEPEVVSALQLGLAAPVTRVPDFDTAVARGAALVAAAPFRNVPVGAPSGRRTGRVVLVGAAVAALLGGTGIAVVQLRADRPDNAEIREPAENPVPAPAPEAPPAAPTSEAAVPTPVAEPSAPPVDPTVPLSVRPVSPTRSAPTPEVRTGPVAPSGVQQPAAPTTISPTETPAPEIPAPTTTVGPAETPTPGTPPTTAVGPPNGWPAGPW